jgi:hypothetical protein
MCPQQHRRKFAMPRLNFGKNLEIKSKEILSLTQRIVNGPWDEEENVPERVPKESKPASGLVFGVLGIF